MPKPLKVSRANEIAGLFILLGLALALAAVFLGPRTQRWFATTRALWKPRQMTQSNEPFAGFRMRSRLTQTTTATPRCGSR